MKPKSKVRVLFVCMGNICRSPTAHGVFRHLVEQQGLRDRIEIDSAGTHAYHLGEAPDPRAQETARRRGVDLSDLRARAAGADDMSRFDLVLAMDEDNYRGLHHLCPPGLEAKIGLVMDYAPEMRVREVPIPITAVPTDSSECSTCWRRLPRDCWTTSAATGYDRPNSESNRPFQPALTTPGPVPRP